MPTISKSVVFGFAIGLATSAALADEAAGGAPAPTVVKPLPEGINCVWRPTLRNGYYTVIDDSHMVIEATSKKYYLITFGRYCQDLDTGFALAFEARGDQLCTGDSVRTRHDRCMINYLEEVPSTADAKALVKARELARTQAGH